MTGSWLDTSVRGLLHQALDVYRDNPRATGHIHDHLARLDQPLRVAVVGRWRSGKSTLLNALLGEEVAPVDGNAFTWYEDGPQPDATAYSAHHPPQRLAVLRSGTGMRVDLAGWRTGELSDIVVRWPARSLRQVTLLDTPPVGVDEHARDPVLERVLREADAMLYLTRDARGADLRVLQRTREGAVGQAAAVHIILVLSRVDESGGGRVDALLGARQRARRALRDPHLDALCVTAVACSGLLGLAGRVLGEADFAGLAALAQVPRAELEPYLLSAERFARSEPPVPLDAATRSALLDRLGVVGVRLATTLARTGHRSRTALSAELVRHAGLSELRESINRLLVDRRTVLKARSALVGMETLLRGEPAPGAEELLATVEQILAGAHEFQESRLLAALRSSRLGFDAESTQEARRLVGGDGDSPAARLGIAPDAQLAQLWEAAADARWRWQERAVDPALPLAQRRGAQVVARSCEGMLAELAAHAR
ncbi:isoniazid-inducible protein iniC [Micromonospora qiuiae]|uniref:Isoniazid-inducible protein iniC n=1 Tax=Micromonospora qiuiae TaxID=502268 RepID=A0ABQ4J598_9ACTN|nr:dynamin family protein [Micromonospora qiuiae]GIJ25190.1 isoniazid-inducible protein iniC [Micromonospora qiuiae]